MLQGTELGDVFLNSLENVKKIYRIYSMHIVWSTVILAVKPRLYPKSHGSEANIDNFVKNSRFSTGSNPYNTKSEYSHVRDKISYSVVIISFQLPWTVLSTL